MKTIKLNHIIALSEIKKVNISNEFMGTKVVQSEDEAIHINAELYLRMSSEADEISIEDFINVKSDEDSGIVNIEIDELDLDEDDYDLSHRSEISIAIPSHVKIKAETDNYYISVIAMNNDLEISNENGPIKLEECAGDCKIVNENGPIKLLRLTGNLDIVEENGPISADSLSGTTLNIKSENGAIKLRECQYEEVNIENENGMVYYESLPVDSGSITITNENGHINLALSPLQGFSLEAKAELGQIKNSFMGQETTMFDTYNIEVGDSALKISLTTENGMIKISSSDMIGGDFFKGKLEYIKEMLKDNSEAGIKETHKIIGQLLASLTKMLEKVKDEDIREKIEKALALLKSWKAKINDPEVKDNIKDTFDNVSQEVGIAIQEALKATQEAMIAAKEKYKEEFKPQFDKHFDKGREFFKHFKGFSIPPIPPIAPRTPQGEVRKEAMQEKARMKILEMLEAGKITADEAEKLLKAIH
jgi:DUF4097 and DUF4098 domain-containing protein YvlB